MNQDLQKTLWAAADKLRSNMDAAEYKHVVLGLIFLKYISDAFDERREDLKAAFTDPKHELYIGDDTQIPIMLEDRDFYTMANVFWVPESARWEAIRNQAKQPDIGKRIDDALIAIEQDNARLKGILDKRFARTQLEPGRLGELIDLISSIGFGAKDKAKDTLGEVYEYFLGQFASAEGKKGGQFYTPASVVKVLVEVLSPHKGKVYDPCCGSGGMFVQSEKFVESHGGKFGDLSIYGQEANPTTWRLVAMNLAIRGMDFNLGKEPADTFHRNQHPDLKADYILANPPFNISDWGGEKLVSDPRWVYGTPPTSNANFAWLQHIIWHLNANGKAGVVLANASLTAENSIESSIRKSLIESDLVDCVISLPGKLFFTTPIPVSIWVISKNKKRNGERSHEGRLLLIDGTELGTAVSRTLSTLDNEQIEKIAETYHSWLGRGRSYADVAGFCREVSIADVRQEGFGLQPAQYVGSSVTSIRKDHATYVRHLQGASDEAIQALEALNELQERLEENLSYLPKRLHELETFSLEEFTLSDFLERSDERLGDGAEPEILTCTERAGLILQRERFSKRVATEDTSSYKIVRRNDIVFNPMALP